MTSEQKSPAMPRWVRKLLIPALIGGVTGFAASTAMLRLIDSTAVGGLDSSATIAALVAVFYIVVGIGILFGAARPGIGARYLNVEDADELREQKRVLTLSGWAMTFLGGALLALAVAVPDGPLPQSAALFMAASGLAAGCLLSVLVYRASDELMLAVNLEAASLSYGLVFLVIGIWSVLAHLGYVSAPAPLDLLTVFYVLVLAASFIAVGRRGMLAIR